MAFAAGVTSPGVIGYTDPRANSWIVSLTPNTETTYGTTMLDLHAWGPTVIEVPPASLCLVDDFWFRYVADMGIAGPDKGRGGKYLFLPPDFDGEVPDGYFASVCPTYTNFVALRALEGVPAIKQVKIYPLSRASAPPENEFINLAEICMNLVHANDFTFYEEVNEFVQEEPAGALDAERAGQLAAIGIIKCKPFAPDARMRASLERAAPIGAGISRAIAYAPRDPEAALYGSWKNAFVGSYEFLRNGARLLDARTQWHYIATGVTPAMAHPQADAGSVYAYTVHDATGALLDGGKTYRLHVDPHPPAKNFWALDVTTPRPGRCSRSPPPSTPPWPATPATSKPTRTAPTTFTSGQTRPKAKNRTGLRPSPENRGSSYSVSTDPCSPGSIKPGSSTSSSHSTGPTSPRTPRGATRHPRRSNLPGLRAAAARNPSHARITVRASVDCLRHRAARTASTHARTTSASR